MIDPSEVSAVLVTRGNVDMTAILYSIAAAGITDVVIWDNAKRDRDLSCYGRYEAIKEARNPVIFHQDDDLTVPIAALLAEYDPVADRDAIVCNNRAEEEWLLTAMGALFHRDLGDCFSRYIELYGFDADFCRVSDVIFAYQHPYRRVVLGYEDLPWHSQVGSSMYLEHDHYYVRERALARTRALPDPC